jgi:hypothetical protein
LSGEVVKFNDEIAHSREVTNLAARRDEHESTNRDVIPLGPRRRPIIGVRREARRDLEP